MKYLDRIEVKADVSFGKPVVRGTRVAVELVLQLLASDWTVEQILENYANLNREDILACVEYAGELVKEWSVFQVGVGGRHENIGK